MTAEGGRSEEREEGSLFSRREEEGGGRGGRGGGREEGPRTRSVRPMSFMSHTSSIGSLAGGLPSDLGGRAARERMAGRGGGRERRRSPPPRRVRPSLAFCWPPAARRAARRGPPRGALSRSGALVGRLALWFFVGWLAPWLVGGLAPWLVGWLAPLVGWSAPRRLGVFWPPGALASWRLGLSQGLRLKPSSISAWCVLHELDVGKLDSSEGLKAVK